jgi:hypothetical protein
MSNKQKIDLSQMDEFQREVYKNFGIVPEKMEEVNNKLNLSDEEKFQEEIARRQKQKYPSDEKTEEELLELKAADLLFEKTFKAIISASKEKGSGGNVSINTSIMHSTVIPPADEEHQYYLSDKEKKEKFVENVQSLREQMRSLKNKEIENIKANPEESLKKLYKTNLDMRKEMAKQSLKNRFLEKEVQGLADRLAAELNKTILDRIKESIVNIFKSFKKEVKDV